MARSNTPAPEQPQAPEPAAPAYRLTGKGSINFMAEGASHIVRYGDTVSEAVYKQLSERQQGFFEVYTGEPEQQDEA